MKTLSNIKKEMEFNKGLTSLIDVIKNIAIGQYRMLESRFTKFDKLFGVVDDFFKFIDMDGLNHPFISPKSNKQIVIAVTSDRGLLGGLNARIVNTAVAELAKIPGKLIVIGERGKVYAQELGVPTVNFPGITDEDRLSQAIQLRGYVFKAILEESIGYVKIIYPHPVSLSVQRVETLPFLPCTPPKKDFSKKDAPGAIIMESRPGDALEYLLYTFMGEKLNEIFGLSRLAEFGARFVHLEECTQKLEDIDKKARLQYFRVKHELVDRNMREISSARLLYASKQG